jgi:anti-sigma-K factor RskA
MSSRPPLSPDDRDWLAAEHALGLTDGDALAEARHLTATDPAFRTEVRRWSTRLAPLLDEIDPVTAPAHLLPAIERRLVPSGRVLDLTQRVRRWKVATGGMTALAASLALALLVQPRQVPLATRPAAAAHAPMVAMLEGGPNRLVATWNGDRSLMVVPASVSAAEGGHSHQLWMIPKDGKPRSMGVMPEGPMQLEVEPATAILLADGATFAVSLEPSGGSPTGLPTGPVIASGALVRA